MDRSNYTICRVLARLPSPPRITARPEVAYQPLLLCEIAALALVKRNARLPPSLPADIEALLDAARKRKSNVADPCRWDLKDRACPDITYLRIGNIGEYPGFLNHYMESAFSCPLATQAPSVLSMLKAANEIRELDNYDNVSFIINERYRLFLELQTAHPNEILVPPLDVQVVWFTHMLQSNVYPIFISKHSPLMTNMPHVATRGLSPTALADAMKKTKGFWKAKKAKWKLVAPSKYKTSLQTTLLDPGIVLGDRNWYRQFVNATLNNADLADPKFFARAALGYQRYIFLVAKWTNRVEAFGFAPSPAIDLMWHTHIAQPAAFQADWMRILGQVHHHKLLTPQERRRISYYDRNFEVKIWKEEFNEEFQLYNLELSHTPTKYEEKKHYPKELSPPVPDLPPGDDDWL